MVADHYILEFMTRRSAVGCAHQRGREDPRRLRPGEIDPHPETKPSRAGKTSPTGIGNNIAHIADKRRGL